MAPRRKHNASASSSSSSKKSNPSNQPQPCKFGIQHFFERHTQNALLTSQNPKNVSASNAAVSSSPKANPVAVSSSQNLNSAPGSGPVDLERSVLTVQNARTNSDSGPVGTNKAVSAIQNLKHSVNSQNADPNSKVLASRDTNNESQNTPPDNLVTVGATADENLSEVSPEISKSMSLKRFKFSPGMVNGPMLFFCQMVLMSFFGIFFPPVITLFRW